MGISWSSRRRHHHRQHQHPDDDHHQHRLRNHQNPSVPQSSNPLPSPYLHPLPITAPSPSPPPPTPPPPPVPPSYAFAANAPYPTPQYQLPPQAACPYLPSPSPPPALSSYSNHFNAHSFPRPMMGQSNYAPYHSSRSNGWIGFGPPAVPVQSPPPPPPPPPYVDHQTAKKIKNDVNVHKDSIRVEVDQENPDCHLVSFTFDAVVDGSVTIFYFAKEGANCTFTSLYPGISMPVRIPFQKGLGQKFSQPSGTGIDLGFFDLDDLSKPNPGEDIFPLVISAESCLSSPTADKQLDELPINTSLHAQITQAVLEKNNGDNFHVRVIKQILWVDGVRYELREIYGINNLDETVITDNDSGKECVICMTQPKDTAALPCRHMCMCSECAKALRLQSNKCPMCRQPIEELIEIKVNGGPS